MLREGVPAGKVMARERTNTHSQGFLDDGIDLLKGAKPLFRHQYTCKEIPLKEGIDSKAKATLDHDRGLSDEFVESHRIFYQGRIGLFHRNDFKQNVSLCREKIVENHASGLILHVGKDLLRGNVGRVGGQNRCFRTGLFKLGEDFMLNIRPLKGSLYDQIGIAQFSVVCGEKNISENSLSLLLLIDFFLYSFVHF